MKRILMSGKNGNGKHAKVDDEDFERLSEYSWYMVSRGNSYAARFEEKKTRYLHREIMGIAVGERVEIDHINRDKLDNRKSNLRICTRGQNQVNKPIQKNNTSGYKGVSWNKRLGRWVAYISENGKAKQLGLFNTKEEAAMAYNKKCIEVSGKFAYLNIIKNN